MQAEVKSGKVKGLEILVKNTNLGYEVPSFEVIDLSLYDAIEKQRLVAELVSALDKKPYVPSSLPSEFDETIARLTKQFQGKQVIARSSSLHEDGEHSFAGVYNSFVVGEGETKDLRQAVFGVYASMNTPPAVAYRREHGVEGDRMEVIVQEFVEPDWSGVMYTSNPTFPQDLTMEFTRGRNTVVEGGPDVLTVDYDKESREQVFKTEGFPDFDLNIVMRDRIARIGMSLEKMLGPSDIEFAIKDDTIFLTQVRKITDLEQPVEVEIPAYNEDQFIGSTNIKRGTGSLTLPVVKVADLDTDVLKERTPGLGFLSFEAADELRNQYAEELRRCDKRYESGYILILPELHRKPLVHDAVALNTLDELTPHKKGVITTRWSNISSHIMTIARERGIHYASFNDAEALFEPIKTGDILSLYFVGREAHVYREESPVRKLKDAYPNIRFILSEQNGYFAVHMSDVVDSEAPLANDLEAFLNRKTGEKWAFGKFNGLIGGAFTNEQGESILMEGISGRRGIELLVFTMERTYVERVGYKPVPDEKLREIMQGLAEHLRE